MAVSAGCRWRQRGAGQEDEPEWVVGEAGVEKERMSKLMFRFRTTGLVGASKRGIGGAQGQMRALKRGARRLGRQLRRQSVRSLCCVAGNGVRGIGAYQRLSRSSSVDSEAFLLSSPICPLEWPIWGGLGVLGGLRCVEEAEDTVVVKVGMVGDCQTGKTSFMVNYVASQRNDEYVQTVGVTSMEKIFKIQNANIAFSIWDLGGHRQFSSMMPLVCKDADAILLMFDLTRRSTLHSVKQWYVQVRHSNKSAIVVMVGTKYDHFVTLPEDTQRIITRQARLYAQAMDASLFFSSVTHNINVQKIFKVIVAKLFDLPCNISKNLTIGEPIIDY